MDRDIKPYYEALLKWSWLIVLATVVAGLASYSATSQRPSVYRTSATLLVGQFLQSAQPQNSDFNTAQQLANSYATLATSKQILQATIDVLGLEASWDQLAGAVKGQAIAGTQLLRVDVLDTNPERAKVIADEVARQLILQSPTYDPEQEQERQYASEQITAIRSRIERAEAQFKDLEQGLVSEQSARAIQETQSQMALLQEQISTWQATYARLLDFYRGSRTNYLSVIEPARVPQAPIGPDVLSNTLTAAGIGLFLAVAAALLLERLGKTIRTPEDLEGTLGLPALGGVSRLRKVKDPSDHLVALRDPLSPVSEGFRILRTNVRSKLAEISDSVSEAAESGTTARSGSTLVVASAGPGEGKTMTACNLAISMAQSGLRVILSDADLRHRSVQQLFDLPGEVGLTTLLSDANLSLSQVLQDSPVQGLSVIVSGSSTRNPGDLLGSDAMKVRLAEMANAADIVILDSPPLLAVADASILSRLCNSVLLVVDAAATRPDAAQRAKAMLDEVGAHILGVVLNRSKSDLSFYQRYQKWVAKRAEAY